MTEQKPVHSPLGASGAERWMNCPGSVALIKRLALPETDEPEYRGKGTAAHELAAHCLLNGLDAWEQIGEKFHGFEIDKEIADAVQVYLDFTRPLLLCSGSTSYIEYGVSHPAHRDFYGTLDFGNVQEDTAIIIDYKNGAGINVEAENNPQLKYYAFGFLREFPNVKKVIIVIVQPNISWRDPVKQWETTADEIREWAETELIPAMHVAELEGGDLDAGNWCRFCPAKLVCPLLKGLFQAAAHTNPRQIIELTDVTLDREYRYLDAVDYYKKALNDEIYNRLNRGGIFTNCKLVPKKANRVWKSEAADLAKDKFGDAAYSKPEMLSPAEIDKIGATGKKFTREYAYTPNTGLTVAGADDSRVAVKVQTTKEVFTSAVSSLPK